MAVYAIGDVQGCLIPLQKLLAKIAFDPTKDTLWFTGDLVNRGPNSLETLRFIKSLGEQHRVVLGNHDLHLLALAHGVTTYAQPSDTLAPILFAHDREELIAWLAGRPLLHYDENSQCVITHAGISPLFDLTLAKKLAAEVETVLQSDARVPFLQNLYGNQPDYFTNELGGFDRLRCIVNYFTRMRFCYPDGRLDLATKESASQAGSPDIVPWFALPRRINKNIKIIFGHWAALGGVTNTENVVALDTGCVWGYGLTAMRLSDDVRFCVACK